LENKQTQKAGDNAQQLQAGNMIVNIGIDEKRAREIYNEMILLSRKDYTEEALKVANYRITEFENCLLPKMDAIDGALEAFADPSFQLLLVEAQKTAASTERPADYDLLSELLIHRFQKGTNRITRAGISRAVEIVDEISDDALLGLTVFHAVTCFFPVTGNILQGLDVLNDLFGKIIYGPLPTRIDWLDHLDILDAIRINSLGNLKKIRQYYPEMLANYVELGIEKGSENFDKAIEILNSNGLPQNIFVDHALNPDYKRIELPNADLSSIIFNRNIVNNGQVLTIQVPITEIQKKAIESIFSLYKIDESVKNQNIEALMKEWDKRPSLIILREWWDNINTSIQITSVGKVLAHSNAQRCDRSLPPLD
jgi:hypothetical protein